MWIDDQGVCHTVALPDPTVLMSETFRESLNHLLTTAREEVARAVEMEEVRFYDAAADSRSSANEAEFVGVTPPQLLTEPVSTVADLTSLLSRLDYRWRLDVLVALDDYLS